MYPSTQLFHVEQFRRDGTNVNGARKQKRAIASAIALYPEAAVR
jgi:hypothetical protein